MLQGPNSTKELVKLGHALKNWVSWDDYAQL
jgi:hypothetical protein